ncbi:aromatic ring-hydroxylating oxygenase subunit alpha [Solimonas terrae]|uniref:Rieske 2Fe-2S domain-containing protein n=1 Tax=Solimonas terrae TaxID=1396819 RepID=A0A6M2BP18_9GAMM|nr:SRPBCC family protein [Solimonas terrae]NGY03975.1 Rieske 2Fe-2S domain-containing protein [Solimonas terrae]
MSLAFGKDRASESGNDRDWPPGWRTMPHGISVGRYTDPDFAALEYEKLWSRVWQVAARLDEIPQAGDYTVYTIGDQSVLLVRADDATVKAYHNFCPHRGTTLAEGCGHFDRARIVCPFHGWRWDLAGRNQLVLERQEFRDGQLQDGDVALREVAVAVHAGLVFINLDRNPPSFDDYIAPARPWLDGMAIGQMRHYWWKELSIPANWKNAQEAFMEAYHVSATHPQLDKLGREIVYGESMDLDGDLNHRIVDYDAMANGHGRFYAGQSPVRGRIQKTGGAAVDPIDAMTERLMLIVDGMDAMTLKEDVEVLQTLRGKPIPDGSSLGGEFVRALYARAAEQQRPMPTMAPEFLSMWGGEIFLFPNFLILPQAGNCEMYRSRPHPTDPDRCIFEIWSTKTCPAGVTPPRATVERVTDPADPKQLLLIPRQDLSNLARVQKGMHARRMRQTWLSNRQETLILNMHRELDRYLQT